MDTETKAPSKPVRVALYARVSTADKDQNLETQLMPLRAFAQASGYTVVGEFTDYASAGDLKGRTAWTAMMDAASKRKLDLVVVWKLDRAFRSVAHASATVSHLRRWGVGLRSYMEQWLDTSGTNPVGELMFNIITSFAEFEKALIAQRVRAGMARAKAQGIHCGRPPKVRPPQLAA
jgi:DNA invertase Pin-like site-specific DNA recombinase